MSTTTIDTSQKNEAPTSAITKAVIVLLVLSMIGIIVVGALFTTVQGTQGEAGEPGEKGKQGQALPPVAGFLSQSNPAIFTITSISVQQYTTVAIISITATLLTSLTSFSSTVVGVVQGIQKPIVNTSATAYLLNSTNAANITWNQTDSSLVVGPMPTTWAASNSFQFTIVATVQ